MVRLNEINELIVVVLVVLGVHYATVASGSRPTWIAI